MSRENDLKESSSEKISPYRSSLIRRLELALIPLALIGALLFVIAGANRSLWVDEVNSLLVAAHDWHGIVERLREENNLPAYYLILHQWTALLGDSEWVSRGLSGLFYLATIGVLFLIGRSFSGNNRSGFYAAFFYLISTQAIQQAQNLRMYSLLGFVASLSLFFYLRWISSAAPKFADGACLVLSNVLGSFTHMWYFFVIGAQFLGTVFCAPRKTRTAGILSAISVSPFIVLWYRPLLDQLGNGATAWMPPFRLNFPLDAVLQYYGSNAYYPLAHFCFYIVVILLIKRAGYVSLSQFLREPFPKLLLVSFAVTLFLSMVVCVFKPIYWPSRYTIIALPALASLLGLMLARYANPALLLTFSYGLLFWTAATHVQARDSFREGELPPGHSDRQTATYIGQHARKGDVVVFTSLSRTAVDYYLNRQACKDCFREVTFPAQIDLHPAWRDVSAMLKDRASLEHEADKAVAEWTELALRDGASIWFLYGADLPVTDILKQKLDDHFLLEEQLPVKGPFQTSILKYGKRAAANDK